MQGLWLGYLRKEKGFEKSCKKVEPKIKMSKYRGGMEVERCMLKLLTCSTSGVNLVSLIASAKLA